MAQSKFSGKPQDYLDWFSNFNYGQENQILLPSTAPEPTTKLETKNIVPSYQKYEKGTNYVKEHLANHVRNYQEILEDSRPSPVSTDKSRNHSAMDDISSVDTSRPPLVDQEIATGVIYNHYDFSKYSPTSTSLPVYNFRKEIIRKVEEYPVVIIEGETGCGKSTQVPQYILDEGVRSGKHVNILVTQPRKIAATSLANRVCDERGWKLGTVVSYQIGLDNQCSPDTRLAYVTTEVFVQKIIAKKSLNEYTHIVLDEVHERDEHTDFALLLVKKLHPACKDVKIILMSATIECEKFANYFATPISNHLIPAPIVSISDKMIHQVHTFYLNSLIEAYPDKMMPRYSLENPRISTEMLQTAVNLVHLFDDLERLEDRHASFQNSNFRGAVLIFAPGLYEIESIIEMLRKDARKKDWEMYPLHSSLTLSEQRAAFKPSDFHVRKIVVSTNIAESSVTLPDIKYVIDFCLTKVIICDPLTNYQCLKLSWASKSSCRQRSGRVGRVSSGRVYRLVEEHFYDELDSHPVPELCRSSLSSVILKTKQLEMGPPEALLALSLDPPDLRDIYRTILKLKEIGCLSRLSKGQLCSIDGDLTALGKVASALPLDPKLSKLIIMGFLFDCLQETIIIAAGLSLKSVHSTPFQDELNAFMTKMSWSHGSFSDCLAILTAYKQWRVFTTSAKFARRREGAEDERRWARKCYIQLESIKEVHKLVEELRKRLERLKLMRVGFTNCEDAWNEETAFFIKISIAAAFYPNYFRKITPEDYEVLIHREMSGRDPFTTLWVGGLPQDYNVLYKDQLKDLFKDCSKDMSIFFEGSKAYIEFPRKRGRVHKEMEAEDDIEGVPGDCSPAMYLALKMKQIPRIRNMLKLKLISQSEARKFMKAMAPSDNDSDTFSDSLSTSSLMSEIPPPNMPHPSIQTIRFRVTHFENPLQFWVVPDEPDTIKKESYIESKIKMYRGSSGIEPLMYIQALSFCLAPYQDPGEVKTHYYRAKIEELSKNRDKALVYFVDYGNSEVVETKLLLKIPSDLFSIPMMANECALSGVKPASFVPDPCPISQWSVSALEHFKHKLIDTTCIGKIYSVVKNVIRIELFNYESMNPGSGLARISLNEVLISQEVAVKADEPYLSKRNHELRTVVGSGMSKSNYVNNSLSSTFSGVSLGFDLDRCPISPTVTQATVPLRGPWSPLEIKFVGLNRPSSSKNVNLDRNSVNSTHLDLEPQSPYERLMVSPFVALSQSEQSISLHSTTLMPILPGMLGLSLLLFCPYAELRLNKGKSQIVGAIFGLGQAERAEDPIFPDNDIELAFDFNLTHEDIVNINSLRYLMSMTVHDFDLINQKALRDNRQSMRSLVKCLLNENREYCKPTSYQNTYEWNQIDAADLRTPSTKSHLKQEEFVWQLMSSVVLHEPNHKDSVVEKTKLLRRILTDLKAEKKAKSVVVDEYCLLCQTPLMTFMDLEMHITSKRHSAAEHKLYGL